MLKWQDRGIVLSTKNVGEDAILLSVFTEEHGRHLGIVKRDKSSSYLQVGNLVSVNWQARLDEQLGYYKTELISSYASMILADKMALSILTSACAIMEMSLSEREKNSLLFAKTLDLVNDIGIKKYCLWELELLRNSGFELELSRCGESGVCDDLAYVSPKTGRAICREIGLPWHSKLFTYPQVFGKNGGDDYLTGLELTGFFLQNHVLNKLPDARIRLVKRLSCS